MNGFISLKPLGANVEGSKDEAGLSYGAKVCQTHPANASRKTLSSARATGTRHSARATGTGTLTSAPVVETSP